MRSIALDLRLGKQLLVNGLLFVIEKIDGATAVILQRVDTAVRVRFSRNDLARLAMAGQCSDLETPPPAEKNCQPHANFGRLTPKSRECVERRLAYVNAVKKLFPVGPENRALAIIINETAARLEDKSPPSPHTVYRWLRRFIASGYDSTAFARDTGVIRTRKSRLPDGVYEHLTTELMNRLGDSKGATVHGVYDQVLAAVAAELGYTNFRSITGTITPVGITPPAPPHPEDDSQRKHKEQV